MTRARTTASGGRRTGGRRGDRGTATAELAVHARGDGVEAAGSLEKPERLELGFAREAYDPGESARVVIPVPFAGSLLLTIESAAVEWARVFRVEAGTFEADLPIPADCGTTLYAGAVLVRTLSGKIQLVRHQRQDQGYRTFDDEDEAVAFLEEALLGN